MNNEQFSQLLERLFLRLDTLESSILRQSNAAAERINSQLDKLIQVLSTSKNHRSNGGTDSPILPQHYNNHRNHHNSAIRTITTNDNIHNNYHNSNRDNNHNDNHTNNRDNYHNSNHHYHNHHDTHEVDTEKVYKSSKPSTKPPSEDKEKLSHHIANDSYLDDANSVISTSAVKLSLTKPIIFDYQHGQYRYNINNRDLSALTTAGLVCNISKCVFGSSSITYLGYRLDSEGIQHLPERIDALLSIPVPTTAKKLRSLMGAANYLRDSIEDFALITKPLCKWIEPALTPEQLDAFHKLKMALQHIPKLFHLNYDLPIHLAVDGSKLGVGGLLFQYDQHGKQLPIMFLSYALNPTQQNWETQEIESFAIYFCVMKLRELLLGTTFNLHTDHRNLLFIKDSLSSKIIRWRLRLQEFSFTVQHIPGKENIIPDAFSRIHLIRRINGSSIFDDREHLDIITTYHNDTIGHHGISTTIAMLKAHAITWPTMRQDVTHFIHHCPICQKSAPALNSAFPLKAIESYEPLAEIALDAMGPFSTDNFDQQYIVVAICSFTRFIELKAVPSLHATHAAQFILELCGRYGCPKVIKTDNGTQFDNHLIQDTLEILKVQHKFSIPYRHQSNGIVERANKEVLRHLRNLVQASDILHSWSTALPFIQRIMNASVHSSTGFAPAFLVYGPRVNLNRTLLKEEAEAWKFNSIEHWIQETSIIQENTIAEAQLAQAIHTDKQVSAQPEHTAPSYNIGDLVLALHPSKQNKLTKWTGPYTIISLAHDSVTLRHLNGGRHCTLHVSNIKPYCSSPFVNPVQIAAKDHNEFVVERIISHRGSNKKNLRFLVHWQGYPDSEDSEIGYYEVSELAALDVYLEDHPELKPLFE